MSEEKYESLNFIEQIIEEDLNSGKNSVVHTRFPPEPNGYLHIGHAKAICINFGLAKKYGGKTNLRFDDTNPTTEETHYVEAIKKDIKWLGFDWDDREYFASDYFGKLFEFAKDLIRKGLAYVDESTPEEIATMKGTTTKAGKNSPFRERPVDENLNLFIKMKEGDFEDGAMVLRAKIDMAHTNMLMRDPVLYRIKHETHHMTGDDWCIYPLYDFAHGQSDSIEGITYSLCSLEFIHHRELYNWLIEKLEIFPSRQIEFARMNVTYMITSKRKLLQLVEKNLVSDWDDPRMPTLSGMRRRGYPAAAIRNFCDKAGVAKRDNVIEVELLESCIREELNKTANRVMVVLDPLKLTISNYPDGKTELLESDNNPEDESAGKRNIPFTKHIYIEQSDFMEDPPKKFFRLGPGRNVRLKNAYIIQCDSFIKNESTGEIEEVLCSYYPESKSGSDTSGIKAKGTLHWVSQEHGLPCEIRNYDRLFIDPNPTGHKDKDYLDLLNPDSLSINKKAIMEPFLMEASTGDSFQFLRKGYFSVDPDSDEECKVFNRTVTLRDTWAKIKGNR
jgi:glutaminyl-tRNA synthetase